MVVVADSTPLNYLSLLSDFALLRDLYNRVLIPPAVFEEVITNAAACPVCAAVSSALGSWIEIRRPPDPARVRLLMQAHNLEQGESEAILAGELRSPLLLDETSSSFVCGHPE